MSNREDNHVIVAAACKYGDIIVVGARHYDPIMHTQLRALRENEEIELVKRGEVVQGFIDNKYQFLTRTEAWKVAEKAGQIKFRCGGDERNGGTLYSENLY